MALINQNDTFDNLQIYIDKKIGEVTIGIKRLFDEYRLKELIQMLDEVDVIIPLLDEIELLASMEAELYIIAGMETDINEVVSEPLRTAILEAKNNANNSYYKSRVAEAEAMTADSWSNQGYQEDVIDYSYDETTDTINGTPLVGERSAYHWSKVASSDTEWGNIGGDINNQTDLIDELNKKFDKVGGTITGNITIDTTESRVILKNGLDGTSFVAGYDSGGTVTGFAVGRLTGNSNVVSLMGPDTLEISAQNEMRLGGNLCWTEFNFDPDAKQDDLGFGTPGQILATNSQADGTEWINNTGGGGGVPEAPEDGTVYGRMDASWVNVSLDSHNHDTSYYLQTEFIDTSAGGGDAGKPIVLDSNGKIDTSMLDSSTFHYVGDHDPSAGTEYPDTTGENAGAFWLVNVISNPDDPGADPLTYTFTSGDLDTLTIRLNDFMVWGTGGWSIMSGVMNPNLYILKDKSSGFDNNAADLSIYGKLTNVTDGTADTDAATVLQVNAKQDTIAPGAIGQVYSTVDDGSGNPIIEWADSSGGIPDAPADGSLYGRQDNAWELAATAKHNHDSSYAPISHTHTEADITDLDKYTQSEVDTRLNTKEDSLGVGTAGQLLATNSTADGKEWIDPLETGLPDAPSDGFTYARRDANWVNTVDTAPASGSSNPQVNHIRTCTQAEYDGLTPVEDVMYIIVG